jgi:hypothetical protein
MKTTMIKITLVLLIMASTLAYGYGQEIEAEFTESILTSKRVYPSPIKSKDTKKGKFKFKHYENQLNNDEDYLGYWEKVEQKDSTLNLLINEDCPQGDYISFYDGRGNVFSYYDEYGSSIDFMFDYKKLDDKMEGTFTTSNAIVFEEENKGESFEFVIQYFDAQDVLILISDGGQIITYKRLDL